MTLVKFNADNIKKNGAAPSLNTVFDSIFNDTFFSDRAMTRVPATNISESTDHYHVELAVPGLKKEDFKLKLERDVLSISVEQLNQDLPQDRTYARREYSYSSFVRCLEIRVDQMQACYLYLVNRINKVHIHLFGLIIIKHLF